MALTVTFLEKLKPETKRREFPDGKVQGLFFVLQPSGSGSWALRYRFGGRPRKLTLGPWPTLTLEAARKKGNEARVVINNNRDPGADKIAARREARFASDRDDLIENVVRSFLQNYGRRKLKGTTLHEVERILGKEIVAKWGKRRLSDVTPPDVHRLLDKIVERPAPIAANRVHAWFKLLCSWAVERQIIAASPCALIKPPSEENSRERFLSDDELRAVWRASESLGWPYGNVVQLLILTGQRRAEVTEMRWDELDLEAKTWTLPAERAKNGREHSIPLTAPVIGGLQRAPRIDGSEFVFTFSGAKPLAGYALIKRRIDDLLPKDTAPWTLHDLRRTFASGLARMGVAVHVTEKLLNHAGGTFSGIAGVYQRHEYRDEQRAAAEAWARHVDSLVSGETDGNVVTLAKARG